MNVRYPQSKERSAEVLRAVLVFIGQHPACCNPATFSVWCEYAAGMNAASEGLRGQRKRPADEG
jgi:diguanylate cyclase